MSYFFISASIQFDMFLSHLSFTSFQGLLEKAREFQNTIYILLALFKVQFETSLRGDDLVKVRLGFKVFWVFL